MTEHERDPLEEMRGADRWMTKRFYDRLADAWQAEREEWGRQLRRRDDTIERYVKGQVKTTNNNLSQLVESRDRWKAKAEAAKSSVDAVSDTLDDVRDEVIRLEHERDELQTKLDASMPLPLDADGVPCRIGDEMEYRGKNFVVCAVNSKFVIDEDCLSWLVKNDCHHVAPKPETIEDVREEANGIDWGTLGDDNSSGAAESLIDRAYECGKRDGTQVTNVFNGIRTVGGDAS
jgi:hypothetical protein